MTDDEVPTHKNMPPDRAAYLLHLTKFAGFRSRMFIDERQIYSYFFCLRSEPPPPAENRLITKIDQDNDQGNDQVNMGGEEYHAHVSDTWSCQ